jgi:hypothetical protein
MKLGDLWIYLLPNPTVGKAGNREGRKEGREERKEGLAGLMFSSWRRL